MSSRRSFLKTATLATATACCAPHLGRAETAAPLDELSYADVELAPGLARTQFEQTQSVLMALNEDSLLKPWRLRAGLPAPGPALGGWYDELPRPKAESGGHGFAPAHCTGQWISALARGYAITQSPETKARLEKILALYSPAISGKFYKDFRFPAYNFDKMVIGLIDAHQFAGLDPNFELLNRTADAAEPHLPPTALDRDEPQRRWRESVGDRTSNDYTWDESYTMPENLYLAWERGAGDRYRALAGRFLLDRTYFDPLARNENVLGNHHAYSFCNALSSAMQCYLSTGSRKHFLAASNAFTMIAETQSFATGGWGPNESFSAPGSDALYKSLTDTHRGFETPCGSYAHFKLTRSLLRVTRDGRYGDSMERVFYNTVLGARQLEKDGHAFYYSDYNQQGARTYFPDRWPCCSGTLPQVAADYHKLIAFRDQDGILVNLYLPSTVKWVTADGAQSKLILSGGYPAGSTASILIRLSKPSAFTVKTRIPAWASGAKVQVNGKPVPTTIESGFASMSRRWNDGDGITVDLPLTRRLEAIDKQHPETVALLQGPLVLFPIGDGSKKLAKAQLLSGENDPKLRLLPFTEIGDQPYSTYFTLA